MTCDTCSSYGVVTVAIKRNKRTIEICFECIEEGANA